MRRFVAIATLLAAFNCNASSVGSEVWRKIVLTTASGLEVEAEVDNNNRLTRISLNEDGQVHRLSGADLCFDGPFDLSTLDAYVEYVPRTGKRRVGVSIELLKKASDLHTVQHKFDYFDSKEVVHQVIQVDAGWNTVVLQPPLALNQRCSPRKA